MEVVESVLEGASILGTLKNTKLTKHTRRRENASLRALVRKALSPIPQISRVNMGTVRRDILEIIYVLLAQKKAKA